MKKPVRDVIQSCSEIRLASKCRNVLKLTLNPNWNPVLLLFCYDNDVQLPLAVQFKIKAELYDKLF